MRLNLGCGNEVMDGYVNIDARTDLGDKVTVGDAGCLDWFCADGSVDEIAAHRLVQCFNVGQVVGVIRGWIDKLKPGGILRFSGYDFDEIAEMHSLGRIQRGDLVNVLCAPNGEFRSLFFSDELTGVLPGVSSVWSNNLETWIEITKERQP